MADDALDVNPIPTGNIRGSRVKLATQKVINHMTSEFNNMLLLQQKSNSNALQKPKKGDRGPQITT